MGDRDVQSIGPSGTDGEAGCPEGGVVGPELVRDVWQRVWDLLSLRELARLAGVSREWRSAAAARTAAKRAEVAALVTAHDSVPDPHLTVAQWVFRAATRVLRGLDAFTGAPLDTGAPGWMGFEDRSTRIAKTNDCRGCLIQSVNEHGQYLGFTSRCRHSWCESSTFIMCLSSVEVGSSTYSPTRPFRAKFTFEPHTPEESVWLQGLLLALSHSTLVNLRHGKRLPRLKGPLSRCVDLSVRWWNMEDEWQQWLEARHEGFASLRNVLKKGPPVLGNSWPPTRGDCFLPLTLLKRRRRADKAHYMRFQRHLRVGNN